MFSTHVQTPHCNTYAEAQNLDLNDKFIKMTNRPTTSMPLNESQLVNQCRRFLVNGKLQSPMDHIRMLCLARGTSGIYNLGRSMRRLADQGDQLSLEAFVKALNDIEMDCTDEEAADIFQEFDTNGTGHIDMKEFLLKLRLLTLVREQIVDKCFTKSDKDGDDVISVADLRRSYSVKHHPSYVNGDSDKESIMKRFLDTFEEGDNPLAKITHEEFLNYYAGISASITDDGYFDLLLREEYNL